MSTVNSIVNKLESTSLETCFDRVIPDNDPSPSNPISVADFINNAILLEVDVNASAATGASGTYIVSGYQGAPSGAQSVGTRTTIKYVNMAAGGQGNITYTATATYPNYVAGWYTATGGGGTQLVAGGTSTTSLTLTQTSTSPNQNAVWAHFGRVDGSTFTAISLSSDATAASACATDQSVFYTSGNSSTWMQSTLFTDSSGQNHAPLDYYSDGVEVARYNGAGSWSNHTTCAEGGGEV